MRLATIIAILVLASGCASWPRAGTVEAGSAGRAPAPPTGAPASGPAATSPDTVPEAPGSVEPAPPSYHAAGQALLGQARSQAAAGETAAAGATLERALRVDPDNPWIWIELAGLRYAEGDPASASSMASKALSLAGRDAEAAAAARRLMSGAGR